MNTPISQKKIIKMDHSNLRRIIHDLYIKGELVTEKKLLEVLNEDPTQPKLSRTTLGKILKRQKFGYVRGAVLDLEYISAQRRDYVDTIKRARMCRQPIYYLIETCLNPGPPNKKRVKKIIVYSVWNEETFDLKDELVFEAGYNTDCHNVEYTAEFMVWFEDMLRKLEYNAIVIMSNSRYEKEHVPAKTWSNEKIQEWLVTKGISINDNLTGLEKKRFMLKKVDRIKRDYQFYDFQQVCKDICKEIDLLTTPKFHEEINPSNFVSSDFEKYVRDGRKNETLSLTQVEKLLQEYKIAPEIWKEWVKNMLNEEKRLYTLESQLDFVIETHFRSRSSTE